MPVVGLYKGQSSPLYTVNTAGKAVEVGYSTIGKAATVKSELAAGEVVIINQPQ